MATVFCKKSYPDFKWNIPKVKSALKKDSSTIESPPHRFCDGDWVIKVGRNGTYINFTLCKDVEDEKQQHVVPSSVSSNHNSHKICVHLEAFQVSDNDEMSPLFYPWFFITNDSMKIGIPSNGKTRYSSVKHSSVSWTSFQQTDALKIICRFRCMDCPVTLAYIPIPSDQAVNALKRKHPEEDLVALVGSKGKMPRPSGEELMTYIKDSFSSGEDSDLTIKVKHQEFKAHKIVLKAKSTVFYKMFSHDMYEKKTGVIEIDDCEPDAFRVFLIYMYTGALNVSKNIAYSLYHIGHKYCVQDIKDVCAASISEDLNVENFFDILAFSELHEELIIQEAVSEFFIKNAKEITATHKWLPYLGEHPVKANELFIKAIFHYANA